MGKETFTYEKNGLTVIWQPKLCIHSKKCWQMLPGVFSPAKRPWINLQGGDNETIINQIQQCPSGALSYLLAENEPATVSAPSGIRVTLLENGPIIMDGDICIASSNGSEITRTGKVAFCRCGGSASKPFCDGSHVKNGFTG